MTLKKFSKSEIEWINSVANKNLFISVQHPNWKGIKSSSNQLFQHHYDIPDNITQEEIEHHAHVLIESSCSGIVLQGFPNSFFHLINYLKEIKPNLPIYLIYHGNFMHTPEDYSWWAFKSILTLAKEGKINKIGFVKQGMAEVIAKQGLNTYFIKNYYDRIPEKPSIINSDKISIGIWTNGSTWQKAPYSMIAACSMINNSIVYGSGFSQRAVELCLLLNIDYNVHFESIPHKQVLSEMQNMHLNLYVTFSECAPMLPLESLSLGVPCLIGPNNHYFQENPFLHDKLVVKYPDSSYEISKKINGVLEERDRVISESIKYLHNYNKEAKQSVVNFLEN